MVLAAVGPALAAAASPSWIFRPSYYSHSPATGERVVQFAPPEPAYVRVDDTYMESGYRHNQRVMRGLDGTADRTHIVQTWGNGDSIRPYGEWEYPFRPGATPYGPWSYAPGAGNPPYYQPWAGPYGPAPAPYSPGMVAPYGAYPQYPSRPRENPLPNQ